MAGVDRLRRDVGYFSAGAESGGVRCLIGVNLLLACDRWMQILRSGRPNGLAINLAGAHCGLRWVGTLVCGELQRRREDIAAPQRGERGCR